MSSIVSSQCHLVTLGASRAVTQAVTLAAIMTAGCVDPEARYNEFEVPDAAPIVVPPACVQFDPSGQDYYLSLEFVPFRNYKYQMLGHFLQFTADDAGELTGQIELRDTDQSLDDTPKGVVDTVIQADGRMSLDIPELEMVIADINIIATLSFEACMIDELTICGVVTDPEARVVSPIPGDLLASTFGGVRLDADGGLPDVSTVASSCPAGAWATAARENEQRPNSALA